MPSPPPFPIRIDDLSVDFLAEALDHEVVDFDAERIGADRGMLGEIFLLRINAGEQGERTLVAKFAALREATLATGLRARAYERELRFYEDLLPATPVRAPACHGGWFDPDTGHFLLLQDAVSVLDGVDQLNGLTVEQARMVLTEVAALHARWWTAPELVDVEWLPRLDGASRIDNLTTLSRVGWERCAALLDPDIFTVPNGLGEALPTRIEQALRSIASLPHTLLHSDLRADNLLFDPSGDSVTLVDWQGCGVGPAAFDVAYFLVQSLTVETRRAHEVALISHWQSELAGQGIGSTGTGSTGTGSTDITAGYSESLWYGMAIACAVPVIGDPKEPRVKALAQTVAHRSLAALEDHGQLEAFA